MAEAFRTLGLTCYDVLENYQFLRDDWMKIFTEGGSREEFRRMFEDVDAVTDMPACLFWEEILDAFPEAKVNSCEGDLGVVVLLVAKVNSCEGDLVWLFCWLQR